jgi:hypothetical protein
MVTYSQPSWGDPVDLVGAGSLCRAESVVGVEDQPHQLPAMSSAAVSMRSIVSCAR